MKQAISWADYEGVEGFGEASRADLDELNKALTVGQDINAPGSVTPGDGFAMRVESLDQTLKNLTYSMKHIRLWKNITKLPARNTVEEFNQLQAYSENDDSSWIDEGDLPEASDSSYERRYSVVRFIGTTRAVSHVATLVQPAHGNLIGQETVNGTMHLLKVMERGLFYGNNDLSPLQFDGYKKLIEDNSPTTNIIDMRGLPLSEDVLQDACLTVMDAPNYGLPSHLYLNPKVKADLVKTFYPKERTPGFNAGAGNMVGTDIKGFDSSAGPIMFEPDVFITDGGAAPAAAVGDASKRPGSPAISTGATTPVDATAKFEADDAGDYLYKVVAVNRYGKSTSVALAGAVTVAAGDKVTFGITPAAAGVEHYEIYRSQKDGAAGSERLAFKVQNTAGAGELIVNDQNLYLPYTTEAFLFQQNTECMGFKQLAPMVRIPLATIDTSIRWSQVIYGVPQLYTPGKVLMIRNIGRASGYEGAL
jgi:hypothetical protein